MGAIELIGVAGSLSLLAGWRLYAVVFLTGLVQRLGLLELPTPLSGLDVLANPWVLAVAGAGALAEFLADKVAFVDSVWDAAHTIVRPLGGALLASAVVAPDDPAWQVAALLLGGGASLLSHGAKAGTRAVVNTSPEPFSNIAVSTLEDVGVAGGLWLLLSDPTMAAALAVGLAAFAAAIIWLTWRSLRHLRDQVRRARARLGGGAAPG